MLVVARMGARIWPLARSRAASAIILESVRLRVWVTEPRSRRLKAKNATATTVTTESIKSVTTSATPRWRVGFKADSKYWLQRARVCARGTGGLFRRDWQDTERPA